MKNSYAILLRSIFRRLINGWWDLLYTLKWVIVFIGGQNHVYTIWGLQLVSIFFHLFFHLFFTCFFNFFWASVMRWLDFSLITPPNLFVHWTSWSNVGGNKKVRKRLGIIWHATIWSIWQVRNHIIFRNEVKFVTVVFD